VGDSSSDSAHQLLAVAKVYTCSQ